MEDIYQTYIESQEKGQLGVAMWELSDMNPPPMNTMLERQSREEAIDKREERKGKTVKDVPPTTPGNLNKIQKVPFNPSQGQCVMFFDISLLDRNLSISQRYTFNINKHSHLRMMRTHNKDNVVRMTRTWSLSGKSYLASRSLSYYNILLYLPPSLKWSSCLCSRGSGD